MSEQNSQPVNDIRGRPLPEPAQLAGYGALIETYGLRVPLPPRLAAIAVRHHPASDPDWLLLTPRHQPAPTLRGALEFALKWVGVDLGVLAALFRAVPRSREFARLTDDEVARFERLHAEHFSDAPARHVLDAGS